MSDELMFGIVGCGEITSKRRADSFAAADEADIGMAMDIVDSLAEDIGERFDVPWTTEFEAVLADPEIDAVYLAVPHDLHAPMTIQAAEAGKHVLVEKPIATTVADADDMIAACDRANVTLGVFLPRRYGATYEQARSLVDAGTIGEIVGTEVEIMVDKASSYWEGGYTGRVQTDWRKQKERSGGGVLLINGIHHIDALRELTALEVTRLYAESDTFATDVEVEDFASVTLRYENGGIGTIHVSSFAQREPRAESIKGDRIYGRNGTIVIADPMRVRTRVDDVYGSPGEWDTVEVDAFELTSGVRLINDFVHAVQTSTEPRTSGMEGMRSLEIIEAAYRSAECHQPIELPIDR